MVKIIYQRRDRACNLPRWPVDQPGKPINTRWTTAAHTFYMQIHAAEVTCCNTLTWELLVWWNLLSICGRWGLLWESPTGMWSQGFMTKAVLVLIYNEKRVWLLHMVLTELTIRKNKWKQIPCRALKSTLKNKKQNKKPPQALHELGNACSYSTVQTHSCLNLPFYCKGKL